jgi:hypothetical protein
MPGSTQSPQKRSPSGAQRPTRSTFVQKSRFALLIIDNEPLQRAAWNEFLAAQKKHDKAARELHRHENVDVPAYEKWLHQTFPVKVTTLRELHEEVTAKARKVEAVQAMAALTGRSLKAIWREQKRYEADPEAFDRQNDFREHGSDRSTSFDEEAEDPSSDRRRGFSHRFFDDDVSQPKAPKVAASLLNQAKKIYRRLVQHLHPDRGGEFSPTRQRLWHEVQQAWSNRDVDWLSRIEVQWETANDVLSSKSPLSRLRDAIEELHAARRDAERKVRGYRGTFAWRFSLTARTRHVLHRRTEENFAHDIDFLQRQLAYLNATIAAWENQRPDYSSRRRRRW